MSGPQTILILGGGVGGLAAANRLRSALPAGHRVLLFEREASHVHAPSLVWLMVGARMQRDISRPLDRFLKKGIEVIQGPIESVDPERRQVVSNGRAVQGDHVIVALGTEFCPSVIPGLTEGGHTFCTSAGAEILRELLRRFQGGRIVLLTAAPTYKCPSAPYEAAMLIEAHLRHRGLRERTQIEFFAAEAGPMGVAGPEVSAGVRALVEARGISYRPEHQVTAVDADARRVRFSNGVEAAFDLLIYVPPIRPPRVVVESGLVAADAPGVPVDRHTLATRFERVHAIGDVVHIPLAMGKPLPKAGVFAHGQARVVADAIARAVAGRGAASVFNGHGECFVETGDGRAGFGSGDFYAEPVPRVRLWPPNRLWHLGKLLLEKTWLHGWV